MGKGWDSVSTSAATPLVFRASVHITRGPHAVWAAARQLKASYQENVKGKNSSASFSGPPLSSHIPLVWFHFPSAPDAKHQSIMGYSQRLQKHLKPCDFQHPSHPETERAFLRTPSGETAQPFPHTWSQKDVLMGHVLEWL